MDQNQNPFDLLNNRPETPAQPAQPAQPAKPTAPADDPFAAFDKSESLFGEQPKPATPAQPAQPAAAPNPFMTAQPAQPAKPAATPNPFVTAQPAQPVQPPKPVTPAQPAQPVQPTYYTQSTASGRPINLNQPTGGSYIPPITPDERANTTVPNYVPNVTGFDAEEPMSVGQWLITMLVMLIPCVNIVMIFVWAFGSGNRSRANYFKATLIWAAICIALSVILSIAMAALGVSIMDSIVSSSMY